jgi:hypothetical protein
MWYLWLREWHWPLSFSEDFGFRFKYLFRQLLKFPIYRGLLQRTIRKLSTKS